MEDAILKVVQAINGYLGNYILLFLLLGGGIYFSIKTRFVQVRCFGEGMKNVFGNIKLKGEKAGKGMSSFQALATAIAAQVGTGNIVGASGAILAGGPGAIFWMWIIAFFGMSTIYVEAVLAQETRIVNEDGTILGGPVYYIRRAFTGGFGKFLAGFFAVFAVIALGFFGQMVQANSIGGNFENAFGIPAWVSGLVVAILMGVVIIGGISRLASVTEKIVPIMAVLYLIGGLIVIIARIKYLPQSIGMIFKYAFQPQAIIGGAFGYALKEAITQGAKRGLFSNEAGMGSTPHAHAQAQVGKPHDQGVVAMIGVFIDTFVVLTMTALVVISTLYAGEGPLSTVGGAAAAELSKNNMAQTAFSYVFGSFGGIFVAVCLFFFAFSTMLGWNFFGQVNAEYLFGKGKASEIIYALISVACAFLGACLYNDLVWELQDMADMLIVLPNMLALLTLAGIAAKSAKEGADVYKLAKEAGKKE